MVLRLGDILLMGSVYLCPIPVCVVSKFSSCTCNNNQAILFVCSEHFIYKEHMLYLAKSKTKKKIKTNQSCTRNQLNKEKILYQNFKPLVGQILHNKLPPKQLLFNVMTRHMSLDYSDSSRYYASINCFTFPTFPRYSLILCPLTLNLILSRFSATPLYA